MSLHEVRSEIIASRNHFQVRRIRALQQRAERERTGRFFAEGLRFVAQAAEHGTAIETLLVAPELFTHRFGRQLLRRLRRAGTSCLKVTPEVFHSVALSEEPQGIGIVARQRWEPLPRPRDGDGLCWVALSSIQSPGNLGTLLRTADAVGAAGLILLGEAIDPYDPATVRASMGAIFAQRFARATTAQLAAWKRRHEALLVGTSPTAETDYQAVAYPESLVLFMGHERQGLSPEEQALCDALVRIPMVGSSDSLNLAVATSIMLYEVFNQRRAGSRQGFAVAAAK
jgi:TrmH family RNA methyltransferase